MPGLTTSLPSQRSTDRVSFMGKTKAERRETLCENNYEVGSRPERRDTRMFFVTEIG